MIYIAKDALGRELYPGSKVAYISRRGSNIYVKEREITGWAVDGRTDMIYLHLDNSTRLVNPKNTVRLVT